jgi:hypothetical protein
VIEDNRASASFARGDRLHKRGGRPTEAEIEYRGAIAGGYTEAWTYLGVLLCGRPGREAEAEAALRAGMSCDDAELAARAAVELGIVLDELHGDSEGARDCFEFALTRSSGRLLESARIRLAYAVAEAGDQERAAELFRSVAVRRY